MYYPNGQRIIDSWIVHAGDLFDSIIIDNEVPMTEMPAVQLSALLLERDDIFELFKNGLTSDVIRAALREIGDAHERCDIPPFEDATRPLAPRDPMVKLFSSLILAWVYSLLFE